MMVMPGSEADNLRCAALPGSQLCPLVSTLVLLPEWAIDVQIGPPGPTSLWRIEWRGDIHHALAHRLSPPRARRKP